MARVCDLLHHPAAAHDLERALGPQHHLQHEPQRLGERRRRPVQLGDDRLPARPGRRRRRAPRPAQPREPGGEHDERDRERDRGVGAGAGKVESRVACGDAGRAAGRETGERRQHDPGHEPQHDAQAREHDHGGAHPDRRVGGGGAFRTPRRAQQREPHDLDEAQQRERGGGGQTGQRDPRGERDADGPVQGGVQQRLQDQPLRGESVERRQSGDRHRADQKGAAGPGHAAQQPAEMVEVEAADGPRERPGAEEQQRLEDRVVGDVQQGGGERDRRPGRRAGVGEQQRCAEAEGDDADVLDRVIGEQALEIVLHERPQHAPQARQQADGDQRDPQPARRRPEPLELDADQPVQRDLDHHPRHQSRQVGGRHGVGARQPRVQRHEAGLGAEADQRGDRDERLGPAPRRRQRGGIADRAVALEDEERDPHPGAAEVGDRQVTVDRRPDRRVAPGDEDRGRRDDRHQLPQGEEGRHVARRQHPGERQQEPGGQRRDPPRPGAAGEMVAGEHQRRDAGQRQHGEEESTQRIEPERRCDRAAKRAPGGGRPGQHADPGGAEQRHPGGLHRQPAAQPAAARRQPAAGGEHGRARDRQPRVDRCRRAHYSASRSGLAPSTARSSSSAMFSSSVEAMMPLARSSNSSVRGSLTR